MGNIHYIIDAKNKVIHTKCTGKISLEDLMEHASAVIHDPQFQKGMDSISDVTHAEIECSFLKLSYFRNYIRPFEPIRGKFKLAIIVSGRTNRDAAQLFQSLAEDGIFAVKLFENRDEAESWISSKSNG